MKIKVAAFLSVLAVFSPILCAAQSLEQLNGKMSDLDRFQLIRAAWNPQEEKSLSAADRSALVGFLEATAREPYPADPMHGSNRIYDTNIMMAIDLLDGSGGCPGDNLVKLAGHSAFPVMLRATLIRKLAGNDEGLGRLQDEIKNEPITNEVAKRLLLATTSAMKKHPGELDTQLMLEVMSIEDEAYAHLFQAVRSNWSPESYLPLAASLIKGSHESGFELLEGIDAVDDSVLQANSGMLLDIDEDALKNRRAAGALVVAKHRMKWMSDDEAIRWVSREQNESVVQDVAESLLTTLRPESLVALREHVRDEVIRKSIDQRLDGNDSQ